MNQVIDFEQAKQRMLVNGLRKQGSAPDWRDQLFEQVTQDKVFAVPAMEAIRLLVQSLVTHPDDELGKQIFHNLYEYFGYDDNTMIGVDSEVAIEVENLDRKALIDWFSEE